MTKILLNIGCGKTRIPGSIGVDRSLIESYVDVVHDLDVIPYPFESNYADEIHMYHVLEHLSDPVSTMEEMHRILKPEGIFYIRVPHFSSNAAFTDMTHKRPFSYYSFDVFEGSAYHKYYSNARFNILWKEIKYFGLYPNQGIYAKYIHPNQCHIIAKPFVRIINFLIRLSPMFFERVWCYWVGGACEVVITLRKCS